MFWVLPEGCRGSRDALLKAMAKYPDGASKSFLRDKAAINSPSMNQALADGLEAKRIEPCEVVKGNKKTPIEGYRLTKLPKESADD